MPEFGNSKVIFTKTLCTGTSRRTDLSRNSTNQVIRGEFGNSSTRFLDANLRWSSSIRFFNAIRCYNSMRLFDANSKRTFLSAHNRSKSRKVYQFGRQFLVLFTCETTSDPLCPTRKSFVLSAILSLQPFTATIALQPFASIIRCQPLGQCSVA